MPRSTLLPPILALLVALSGCDLSGSGVQVPSTGQTPTPGPAGDGVLSGVVKYEAVDTPHSGITVRLVGPGGAAETTTDDAGKYRFSDLATGSYELSFERSRYFTATRSVSVESGGVTVPTVTLSNHRLLYASASLYDAPNINSLTSLVVAPGGDRLAFVEGGVLKTIPLTGGTATVVRDLQPAAGSVVDSFTWTAGGLAFAQIEAGATSSILVTSGQDPMGPFQTATSSPALMLCPALSPDGTQLAYLARVPELWTLPNGDGSSATGSFQLAVVKQERSTATATRVGIYPINVSWNYGFGPLEWTSSGLLFHKPMFCDIYRNDPAYGPVGDGIFLLSPTDGALKKLYYYSDYEHTLSPDGQILYFHEGRRVYARRVGDPRHYNQGHVVVGYDRSGRIGNMAMDPAGDRLYYVSPSGIEEMTVLSAPNE